MQELTEFQLSHRITKLPNPLEYLSCVFCLGNLLGGPYLEFSEYKQFMELKGVRAMRGRCGLCASSTAQASAAGQVL